VSGKLDRARAPGPKVLLFSVHCEDHEYGALSFERAWRAAGKTEQAFLRECWDEMLEAGAEGLVDAEGFWEVDLDNAWSVPDRAAALQLVGAMDDVAAILGDYDGRKHTTYLTLILE
jgi:hypothetical protein